jgi:DNA-binding response OmpR family regulator
MAKIALIEDDMAIVQMYRMKFEAEGYDVVTAGDGQAGLTLLSNTNVDIVLLDLMMPNMNGDEMLEELRKTDYGKNLPVIILTNMGENEAPNSIKQDELVKDFILKASMTPKDVAETVAGVLDS